jgi:cell wall-associated NlpC family hydrolase
VWTDPGTRAPGPGDTDRVRRLAALLTLLVTVLVVPAPAPAQSVGRSAWVSVAVARLWQSPSAPRAVDAPALAAPVRFRAWLAGMSLTERRALAFHSDTEALLGERVVVTGVRGSWAHVVVPDQPSPKDPRGYPGWVPLRQITYATPPASGPVATVVRRTTWLRVDTSAAPKVLEVSYGTVLPVVSSGATLVRVRTPLGAVRRVAAASVVVHARGTAARPRTGADLVRSAQSFSGLPYLWGGLSGFGLDCSGLTWVDYRVHGRVISRDALPQSRHGRPVARASLRPGDLIFYATNGLVHHVTMYAGRGRMVEAPHTGAVVRTVPVRGFEYFGARRYL